MPKECLWADIFVVAVLKGESERDGILEGGEQRTELRGYCALMSINSTNKESFLQNSILIWNEPEIKIVEVIADSCMTLYPSPRAPAMLYSNYHIIPYSYISSSFQ